MPDGSEYNPDADIAASDARLILNGYEPVAVLGKAALGPAWSTRPNTIEAVLAERAALPCAISTGLRTGGLVGVDIDVYPAEHVAATRRIITEALGETSLVRIGSKGALLCYRNVTPIRKIVVSGIHENLTRADPRDGRTKPLQAKIEYLGTGQQFVAFGTHPDTSRPYKWTERDDEGGIIDPLTNWIDWIPEVTPEQLRECARRGAQTLAELGYQNIEITDAGNENSSSHVSAAVGSPVPTETLKEILGFISPDCERDVWIKVVGGMRATPLRDVSRETAEAVLLDIAIAWSRGDYEPDSDTPENYVDEGDVAKAFWTLPPKPGGTAFGTLYELARQNGYNKPPPRTDAIEILQRVLGIDCDAALSVGDADIPDPGKPLDLFGSVAPEPFLTRDMLPAVIADYAFDVAERIGVDPALVACSMLAGCASAIDDGIKLQPKIHDTSWTESARLNILINAPPGSNKSGALRAATKPIKDIEVRWRKEDAHKLAQWEAAERLNEAALKHVEKEVRNHGPYTPEALNPLPSHQERPVMRRLVINDITSEGVCKVLRDNPRGILLEVDEAMGWIASFDAYRNGGGGKDRAFWLQTDNGGSYSKDRADEKNSIHVPNLSASIVGGIQPEKLRQIAKDLIDDGLLQRAFVITARDVAESVDRAPDVKAEAAYEALLAQLLEFALCEPAKVITLNTEAHSYRKEVDKMAEAYLTLPTTSAALKQHIGKWRGRFARLLLTFHAIECASQGKLNYEVQGRTAKQVRDFMLLYLLPQQVRFYTEYFQAADVDNVDARWIAGYILAHKSEQVTLSEIKRAYHTKDEGRLTAAMELLQAALWVRDRIDDRAKRSVAWPVNPVVHCQFVKRAELEKAERETARRKIEAAAARVRRVGG